MALIREEIEEVHKKNMELVRKNKELRLQLISSQKAGFLFVHLLIIYTIGFSRHRVLLELDTGLRK